MMATTHALAGLLVGAIAATVAPELALPALAGGFAGGLAPDLDLYVGHRRLLHYPVAGWAVAAPAVGVAALWPGPWTVGVAVFVVAAVLHAASDVLGGGLELRPWEARSERAVYDHVRGRWIRPRRLVRYDGAPEDALLAWTLAIPTLLLVDPLSVTALSPVGAVPLSWPATGVEGVVLALVATSVGYAAVRRWIPDLTEFAVGLLPRQLRSHLPDRFTDEIAR